MIFERLQSRNLNELKVPVRLKLVQVRRCCTAEDTAVSLPSFSDSQTVSQSVIRQAPARVAPLFGAAVFLYVQSTWRISRVGRRRASYRFRIWFSGRKRRVLRKQNDYPLFPNPVVAESLLDRLINTSHQVFMNGP